ncbi:uncharacterized protein LOC123532421 isoform X1 [Mercenaria mercenaria]|uniref:uncharacterized protein LOC123532421 isoform X1 n=1 Tax=Mercenaria mercenaria TaxID=6596 RepID=UPI00234F03A0|nr:uncharacterized protein LOC123532421 isoform X1 [Mercenaria mercenaria]
MELQLPQACLAGTIKLPINRGALVPVDTGHQRRTGTLSMPIIRGVLDPLCHDVIILIRCFQPGLKRQENSFTLLKDIEKNRLQKHIIMPSCVCYFQQMTVRCVPD